MTELGTHNAKGVLIDTTKVNILFVVVVCHRLNESLQSQGIVNLSPNVDQARPPTYLMTISPKLWPTNIIGCNYSRINVWCIARHSVVYDLPKLH